MQPSPEEQAWAGALARACEAAPALTQRQRLEVQLQCGTEDGVFFETAPDAPQTLRLQAPPAVWRDFFSPVPPPGRHAVGALMRLCPEFSIEAPEMLVMQCLPWLEMTLQGAREQLHGEVTEPVDLAHDNLAAIQGHYLQLDCAGKPWVYVEQAGDPAQPVLLMLHTAGADARQWHGLMALPTLQKQWHMEAFDLPGHGRSPRHTPQDNWQWSLSETQYVEWVASFVRTQKLRRVVLMGCSMGSAVSLALLARHPELFAGGLLLETPYRSRGRRSVYLDHPKVHSNRLAATWVASLLSPLSPKLRRDQATWIYAQGAPGVYDGDLAFYSDEFEASAHTPHIDTRRTPLWLLTGDYDYSASPAETQKVAAEIEGARFVRLEGFGHFPMTENPHRLQQDYLQPALSDLHEVATRQKG